MGTSDLQSHRKAVHPRTRMNWEADPSLAPPGRNSAQLTLLFQLLLKGESSYTVPGLRTCKVLNHTFSLAAEFVVICLAAIENKYM